MEQTNHKLLLHELVYLDQTQLITALFKIDEWAGEDERIQIKQLDELTEVNTWAYPVKTPIGDIIIPEHQYYAIIDDYKDKREALVNRTERGGSYWPSQTEIDKANQEIAELDKEVELYDSAEPFERPVFSWWAVPYWLSEKLVEKGEAILRGYGCCWWGITDNTVTHPTKSEVLKEIDTDLLSTENNRWKEKYSQYRLKTSS